MLLTNLILDALPLKRRILRAGARLPPRLRNDFLTRGLCALARRSGDASEAETNLGIDASLKCRLPLDKGSWIFGLPEDYVGERGALALLAALGKYSDAILDVGAHVGYFSYYLAKHVPSTIPIHYFEPDPSLFTIIENNVRSNGLTNVIGHREAMGARSERSVFFQNLSNNLSGSLDRDIVAAIQTREIAVQVRSFDDFSREIDKRNVCVKVDIEGAEQQFVDGARAEWSRIADLVIEVLEPAYKAGFVRRLIEETGMHAYHINDYALERSVDGSFTPNPQEYNWLFTRKSSSELRDAVAGSPLTVRTV
jgi:FkbM family methyltransferase